MPAFAGAQSPFSATPGSVPAGATVGGQFTADRITLRAMGPGVPLRFGGVVPNTERVEFDGQLLKRGVDYSIDNDAGVVYLMRAQRQGQTLFVTYRHEEGRAGSADSAARGVAGMKFDLVPGGMQAIVGLGMTERRADGSVVVSNQYGLNNSFQFGSGRLKGLFLVGEKQQQDATSAYEFQKAGVAQDAGRSQFLLQNFQTGLAGGTVEIGYQDISSNFSGFNSVRDAGYDGKVVDQLQKERGLTRTSLAMRDVGIGGGVKVSNGFRSVGDGSGSVEWKNFGFQSNGLSMSWDSQAVDQGFNRFKDLGEADREQLKKEAGLTRENLTGSYKSSFGKLDFSENKIEDARGNGVVRRTVGLDAGKFKFNMGEQDVDQGFTRVNSLFDKERQSYGPELGLKRQWMSIQSQLYKGAPIAFATSSLSSQKGSFQATDASASGNGWSLDHSVRGVDSSFTSMGAMPDSEIQGHIKAIASMYAKDVQYKPDEKNLFLRGVGVERSFTRLSAQPFKGWNAQIEQFDLRGQKDHGSVRSFALGGKGFQVNLRQQSLGAQFSELDSLMNFEKQRLGSISGLDRTDFGLNFQVAGTKVAASQMVASSPEGDASRQALSLTAKGLDLSVAVRSVDLGFGSVNRLVDPEKDLLATLRGFDQRDIKAKWQILPNLEFEAQWFDANSDALQQDRFIRQTALRYRPDKQTDIQYSKQATQQEDPLKVLFANVTEQFSFSRSFGRYGTIHYLSDKREYDGLLANLPDSTKQYISYETKLNTKTSLKSEQTLTSFDNGDKENISANTVSTQISKGAGVSVTEVNVDRAGEARDETKHNYGFWVDLGGGMRFSYGYARHLNGDKAGTANTQMGMTAGILGGIQFGQTGYVENRWDDTRTQSFGNVQLSTARPFSLGFLRDVKLNFGLDTAADKAQWLKENRLISFTGKVGSNSLGYEYRSQMHPSGFRGIDRMFSFVTDPNDKQPLSASVKYKVRTLPWDDQVMIRDYSFTARPAKNVALTNQLQTNPEIAKGDSILGSITQAARVNRWKLDVKNNPNLTIGGSWDELINDQTHTRVRTGGLNLTLFGASGSPVQLFYGVEQNDTGGNRKTTGRYHIRYDQRPGPNQTLSFFAGNVSYQYSVADGLSKNNLTLRLDYQIRF